MVDILTGWTGNEWTDKTVVKVNPLIYAFFFSILAELKRAYKTTIVHEELI